MGVMLRPAFCFLLSSATVGTVACQSDDIGKPCTGMNVPYTGGATNDGDAISALGSQIVEYNTDFPCDAAVCVATIGSGGYCSRECATDHDCPGAFSCGTVMSYGPFTDRKYCIWRACQTDDDCGDPWTLGCRPIVPYSSFNVCYAR